MKAKIEGIVTRKFQSKRGHWYIQVLERDGSEYLFKLSDAHDPEKFAVAGTVSGEVRLSGRLFKGGNGLTLD